jgi:hypothetical protein
MAGGIRRQDIVDTEIVDAVELASDGTAVLASGITVVSTALSTKRVVCSGTDFLHDADQKLEADDIVVLSGTDGADGTYTVAEIVDGTTFVVVEAIADSTGGTAVFRYPPGALKVGFDPTGLVNITATDLQGVVQELDAAIPSGTLTEEQHKALRQLIHFIDNGPAESFASGAYREVTGTAFPTAVIWYDKAGAGKKKIVEKLISYTGSFPTTIVWKVYNVSEVLLATISDAISYSGAFETSRTRTIS